MEDHVDITSADLDIDPTLVDQVASVLRRMRTAGGEAWPGDRARVHITRVLDGGRSNAVVLQIDVRRANRHSVRVVKVAPAMEMAREWRAYSQWMRDVDANVLCAPIEAVTPGAIDEGRRFRGELDGVLYNHVAQHGGEPDRDVITIENLARAAYHGEAGAVDRILRVIDLLFKRANQALYSRCQVVEARSLRTRNPMLGPDLCVEVDHVQTQGRLRRGSPTQQELDNALRLPDQILRTSLAGGRGADQSPGAMVAVSGLRPVEFDDDALIAVRDDISIAIRWAPDAADPTQLRRLLSRQSVDLHGVVSSARGVRSWDRMRAAFRDARRLSSGMVADDVVTGDPFAALHLVLTDPAFGQVTALVHGDANPRNIMVLDDQPYLIDYARTGDDQPFLTDFVWLEIGLLRDVFADIGYANLVRLQRMLAFGSRLADLSTQPDDVLMSACLPLMNHRPELVTVFRILWAIRFGGRRCYPGDDWWRDGLAQLLFAAHRTVKWPSKLQEPGKLPVSVAVAAVASEWLADANPVTHWDTADLRDALAIATELLASERDGSIELLGQLVVALGSDDAVDSTLTGSRERLASGRFSVEAVRILAEHEVGPSLDLIGGQSDQGTGQNVLSLVATKSAVVLLGDVGSGKTTVARQVCRQLADRITGQTSRGGPAELAPEPRLPVVLSARQIVDRLIDPDSLVVAEGRGVAMGLLAAGLIHLIVDDLDALPTDTRATVAAWLRWVRTSFPRTPILVCHRDHDYDPKLLPDFARIHIHDPSLADVRRYLDQRILIADLTQDDSDRIMRLLYSERNTGLRRPLFVELLATHPPRGRVSIGGLYETYFETALPDQGRKQAELLAARMTDAVTTEVAESELSSAELAVLRDAGVVRQVGDKVRFARRDYQDYLAARSLLRISESTLLDRLSQQSWRAPFRLLVSLPLTGQQVTGMLVDAVSPSDPGFAAELLCHAWRAPDSYARRFHTVQEATLRDTDAIDITRQRAARALATYAAPEAYRTLLDVTIDPTLPVESRLQALRHLSGSSHLPTAVLHILSGTDADRLRVLALQMVGEHSLHDLLLFVAEHVNGDWPWPVVHAAMATLRMLGVETTDTVMARYHVHCRNHLRELEQLLHGLAPIAQVDETQRERLRMLRELASVDRIDLLLGRRFAFQIGDQVGAMLVSLATGDGPFGQLLAGPVEPSKWSRVVTDGDPISMAAAAHRLLRSAPQYARRLLAGVTETASPDRLLIAAAAVPYLDSDGVADAERLFRALLPVVDTDRMVALAALLRQISEADRARGVRLAWLADDALTDRDLPERHGWPWHTVMAAARGSLADLDHLLSGDDVDADLAIAGLASRDFHRDARRGPTYVFSSRARQRLMDRKPTVATEPRIALRWVCAAATMAEIAALPVIRQLVAGTDFGRTAERLTSGRYGHLDNVPLADVLAASGWLARYAYDVDASHDVEPTHRMLERWKTAITHSSVRTGRAIGLAYLGDWLPLLTGLVDDDPRTAAAAENALWLWTPGPFTPAVLADRGAIQAWLEDRIAEPSTNPTARSTLVALAEHRAFRGATLG